MKRVFHFVSEAKPAAKWATLLEWFWPAYERWYTREGLRRRPRYLQASAALRRHMPELLPTYEKLVDLAGGGDVISRFLTLYCPPAYTAACSQVVWPTPVPTLIRNYDYSPVLWEAVCLASRWRQPVAASADCLWGALDGINHSGLAVSLAFGGRRVVGDGFGMPLILRYLLELCETTPEAVSRLCRVPTHMAYNVTIADARGDCATVFCAPDRQAIVRPDPVATNHQDKIHWVEHARATASQEREALLRRHLETPDRDAAAMIKKFMEPPLHSTLHALARGTLYTAALRREKREVEEERRAARSRAVPGPTIPSIATSRVGLRVGNGVTRPQLHATNAARRSCVQLGDQPRPPRHRRNADR